MYSRILVPLDGSQLSESILPYARSIAGALKVSVELLLAIDPGTASGAPKHEPKKAGLDYLNNVATSFQKTLTVDCSVEAGNPVEVIVHRASSHTDILITMSTQGRSGIQRWMIGSVANKVLHATTSPLLIVRGATDGKTTSDLTFKKVLVPLDGSPLSERVLPHVVDLAKMLTMEVVLVRAPAAPTAAFVAQERDTGFQQIAKNIIAETETYLEAKVKQLQTEGLKVSYLLLEGEAAGEIIDLARKTPNNLIAMCTHGWSGIGRWVLGNVTERVVHHSGDPVLIIR